MQIWIKLGMGIKNTDQIWNAMVMWCGCGEDAVQMRCGCGSDALWMRCGCVVDAVWMQCRCSVLLLQ